MGTGPIWVEVVAVDCWASRVHVPLSRTTGPGLQWVALQAARPHHTAGLLALTPHRGAPALRDHEQDAHLTRVLAVGVDESGLRHSCSQERSIWGFSLPRASASRAAAFPPHASDVPDTPDTSRHT